ncbi:hypothetical protein PITC_096260 [Penicillium italicum]|uniref:Uncharacterized protein n=1 Tax=Penicillium italicum TaxID=40296 RepID=A0A0A2KQK0_PENIT|nr:hypothetical protein PITC_096260 [Penicillium italicum]
MVSLPDVQSSNAQIGNTLPAGLVGVFVGATNGIGEAALKEFLRVGGSLSQRVPFGGVVEFRLGAGAALTYVLPFFGL